MAVDPIVWVGLRRHDKRIFAVHCCLMEFILLGVCILAYYWSFGQSIVRLDLIPIEWMYRILIYTSSQCPNGIP